MTFRALYQLELAGELTFPVIGVAVDDWSIDHLRSSVLAALESGDEVVEKEVFGRLAQRFWYVRGDFNDPATYEALAGELRKSSHPLYYLEIPPGLFAPVVKLLGAADILHGARVMIEKPFGHDLASARALNAELHEVLDEDQILRVDHFLGKQPVTDISYRRFANTLLEPVWNREHVAGVYVTLAENFGVENRGAFYDPVGALRDVVQNHLLQVVAMIAMEAPTAPGHAALWDKKVEVFRAMADVDPTACVRGQYDGYLDAPQHTNPNQVIIRVEPDSGVRMTLLSKGPDGRASRDVHLDLSFVHELGKPPGAYERLFHDAIKGHQSLFTREDVVEETWRVLQPLIDEPPAVVQYKRGSWGPQSASDLLRGHTPWQLSWLATSESSN
ncbi:MAG: glucose-6-phosphate dehydrogenase [Acidobacteria bacterium]|nr:glucose-6-phosphate dehydrogenase [Acidobacteriota bacterium]